MVTAATDSARIPIDKARAVTRPYATRLFMLPSLWCRLVPRESDPARRGGGPDVVNIYVEQSTVKPADCAAGGPAHGASAAEPV